MKRVLVFVAALALLGVTACAGAQETTFNNLVTEPAKYSGKTVTIEAYYFHGFETIVICGTLAPSGYAEGHLVPKGEMVWVDGGIPKELFDKLNVQQQMGPTERFGKVKITGRFEYGGQYGHVGGFKSQITPSQVELLPWSLPR